MEPAGSRQEWSRSRDVSFPCRCAHVEERAAGPELVLYDPVGGRLHVLNETAAVVWRLCDGSIQNLDIADRLRSDYRFDGDHDPRTDIQEILHSFLAAGLIEDKAGDRPATSSATQSEFVNQKGGHQ